MMRRNFSFFCCIGVAIVASPSLASEPNRQAPAQTVCDIHIWQRGIYRSETSQSSGLIGALLQARQKGKNSSDSIEDLLEQELNIHAMPDLLSKIIWQTYTKTAVNNLVFEQQNISESDIENIKASSSRNSASRSDCYIEIYIGRQTFSRGGMWSRLFSEIYARTFYFGQYLEKFSTQSKNVRSISITDETSRNKARETFRNAFIDNLSAFLNNKLPKE